MRHQGIRMREHAILATVGSQLLIKPDGALVQNLSFIAIDLDDHRRQALGA